jgi:hypothetical protein
VSLVSETELANANRKLGMLEADYAALTRQTGGDEELREMTMASLKRLINELKEEIARYQARQPTSR